MDIRERVEVLKREEYALNKKLEKYILKIQKDFLKEENWFVHNKEEVNILINEKLIIDYSGKSHYISFLEKTINFSKVSKELEVNSIDEYNFSFKGKDLFKGNVRIFIIEYSKQGEKLRLNSYPLNTEKKLKFNEDVSYIRFAIRTEGTGTSVIESLVFEAEEKTKEKIIETKDKMIIQTEKNTNSFDEKFINNIGDLLKKIPESNGSRYYEKLDIKIGLVADEFLFNSYKGIADFIYVTPENYKKTLNDVDLFFIASTWRGLNNEWNGLCYAKNDAKRKELFKIIKYCKKNKIKTVFYSKEDPVNYDVFIETAKKCDYVFTTAKEKVEDYKKDCKHNNVDVLEFGINPFYHNPIGIKNFNFEKKVIFSGSWYKKYEERCCETEEIFDGILDAKYDLKIIDRNFSIDFTDAYKFPEKYNQLISPAVKHEELQKLHKMYDWAINLNTIKYSNTMFANRIYELQAMGNILISNYSIGVNSKFPNVFIIEKGKELNSILNSFNEFEVYKHQMFGVRTVLSNHCNFEKLKNMLEKVDMKVEKNERLLLVICDKKTNGIKESFERQTYKNKKLITIKEFSEKEYQNVDIIAYFSKELFYEEFYLEDMINGFKYTNSSYITKDQYHNEGKIIPGIENNYIEYIKDINKTLYWTKEFTYEQFKNKRIIGEQKNGYSIDPFEVRLIKSDFSRIEKEYKFSVIIPAYNNGDHLLNKCFNSLRRSTMFDEMEIIIVDDGSTDNYTPKIAKRLEREYGNVKTYFYGDGGSGSASRPRNKGHEISTTEYITYLDPDNEALNDGYTKLYEDIVQTNAELVVGNMLKLTDTKALFNVNKEGERRIKSAKDYIIKNNFPSQSTQALMIKKDLITKNKIDMVNGAIGEDTLFFHELILNSKKTNFIDELIHIYYAAVEGSTVNSITENFYRKHLILEKERIKRLEKYELLKTYKEIKFEYYFRHWYLKKLELIKQGDYEKARKILIQIFNMYSSKNKVKDPVIIEFLNGKR